MFLIQIWSCNTLPWKSESIFLHKILLHKKTEWKVEENGWWYSASTSSCLHAFTLTFLETLRVKEGCRAFHEISALFTLRAYTIPAPFLGCAYHVQRPSSSAKWNEIIPVFEAFLKSQWCKKWAVVTTIFKLFRIQSKNKLLKSYKSCKTIVTEAFYNIFTNLVEFQS